MPEDPEGRHGERARRILLVEDAPSDAELITWEVRKTLPRCEFARVETEPDFVAALETFHPDLILSDYHLPRFDGLSALRIARERDPDVPFVIITGALNEETAVDCMKAGAWDYVIKDRIRRLGMAVQNALDQRRLRIERRRAEDALRESEDRYRSLLELAPVTIAVHSEGRIVFTNPAGARLLGANSPDEVVGRSILDVIHPDHVAATMDRARRLMNGETGLYPAEDLYVRLDGSTVPVEVTATVLAFEGKPAVQIIVTDTSERKRAEMETQKLHRQLVQAQKMESVGRLAGGVAHDFNNMLTVILGHVDMALTLADPGPDVSVHLREIQKAAERSADLARQLLTFARQQTVTPRILNLNETISALLSMLRRLIGEDITLSFTAGDALAPVEIDPTQVDQLMANLCVNARDSISGIGRVTIETANIRFDAAYCVSHAGVEPGDYVMVAVSDNGCGMSKEVQERVFEPFFTTKPAGLGTGLGLSIVYGIVKQNSGFVNVYSEVGVGSTFRIFLPAAPGWGPPADDGVANDSRIPLGWGETVLIVEDEPAILATGKVMLEMLGYRVLTAATPGDAIRVAEQHLNVLQLLVTDVVMPEMNGRDLAARVNSLRPGIKTLFMSGYTADVIDTRGLIDAGVLFIPKPFSQFELAVKVREALDSD